jgi:hypothetical protein
LSGSAGLRKDEIGFCVNFAICDACLIGGLDLTRPEPQTKNGVYLLMLFSSQKNTFSSLHDLASKLAPRSDARAVKDQHPRHNRQQSAHPSQKATSALESHRFEHLRREQRESASQDITAETLRSERGAGVAVVSVGEVVENGEVDAENPHGCAADAESREDPVVAGKRGPAEPEAADGQEDALNAGEIEAAFGTVEDLALFAGEVFARYVLLRYGDAGADYGCD